MKYKDTYKGTKSGLTANFSLESMQEKTMEQHFNHTQRGRTTTTLITLKLESMLQKKYLSNEVKIKIS